MTTEASNRMAPSESGSYKVNSVDTSSLAPTTQEPRKYREGSRHNLLFSVYFIVNDMIDSFFAISTVFPVGKRFRAVIQLDGVRHNLGMHATDIEAARAYDKFAKVIQLLTRWNE